MPLTVNQNLVIVDGHNRNRICQKHDLMQHPAIHQSSLGGGNPYIHHSSPAGTTVVPPRGTRKENVS